MDMNRPLPFAQASSCGHWRAAKRLRKTQAVFHGAVKAIQKKAEGVLPMPKQRFVWPYLFGTRSANSISEESNKQDAQITPQKATALSSGFCLLLAKTMP